MYAETGGWGSVEENEKLIQWSAVQVKLLVETPMASAVVQVLVHMLRSYGLYVLSHGVTAEEAAHEEGLMR